MLCIKHNITNPYFNLAAEEYFLRKSDEEYFLLYINEPSVIIGKHQNAYAETNYAFIRKNNIKVVRRISGGGTVWHDQGNLNFAFIRNGKESELVNFRKYIMQVIGFLNSLGLNAIFQEKNSIVINDSKISGNAEHVFRSRILHHGTLLFNTNLENLEEALRVNPGKYSDRSVKSIRSKTSNIIDHLNNGMTIKQFGDIFMRFTMAENQDSGMYELTDPDYQNINSLVKDKYSTWDWNFGYSPEYEINWITHISGQEIRIILKVEKGFIKKANIRSNLLSQSLKDKLETDLSGQRHKEDIILGILQRDEFKDIFENFNPEEWIQIFF